MAKRFEELSEREILALAISLEEEDSGIYADFADGLRANYRSSAQVFENMQREESSQAAGATHAASPGRQERCAG